MYTLECKLLSIMIPRNSYEELVLYDVARIEQSVQLRMMDVDERFVCFGRA